MPHIKVINILSENDIQYKILKHSDYGEVKSPYDFSSLSGLPITKIAKSLLLKGDDGYLMAVLPVSQRLSMESIAQSLSQENISVAPLDELLRVTDFERHGTTAIGLGLPTVVDSQLASSDVIYVATGTVGEELEINPVDLIKITKAKVAPITE